EPACRLDVEGVRDLVDPCPWVWTVIKSATDHCLPIGHPIHRPLAGESLACDVAVLDRTEKAANREHEVRLSPSAHLDEAVSPIHVFREGIPCLAAEVSRRDVVDERA